MKATPPLPVPSPDEKGGSHSCKGEILVFYLPICFFFYLAKLIIFTRSSRIPCIFFFLKGDSSEII